MTFTRRRSWFAIVIGGVVALLLVLLLGYIALAGFGSVPRDEGMGQVVTYSRLDSVNALVEVAEHDDGPAPLNSKDLVEWLLNMSVGFPPDTIDESRRKIVDYWGHDVVVIAVDGEFFGLASRGQNGFWENGAGDDIVVIREREDKFHREDH